MNFRSDDHLLKAGEIITRYDKALLAYAHVRVRDPQLAEDIVWPIFENICEKPHICHSIREPAWPYLVTCVENAINALKRKERSQNKAQQEFLYRHQEKLDISPEDTQLPGELHERLYELVRNLPEKQRLVLDLLQQEYSAQEIADKLGIAPQTVRNHKRLAISTLRKEAKRLGLLSLLLWLH